MILLARADACALPLRDESVQCCITSPPFYRLRSYDTGDAKYLEIGVEETPEEYIGNLVDAFREVRRVLRSDGTLWVEIGDSWCGSYGNQGRKPERGTQRPINGPIIQPVYDGRYPSLEHNTGKVPDGFKPKDLFGIPWMLAFALRADGWYLRQEIIWAKGLSFCSTYSGACMPESCQDRPSRSHSTVFLLSKSENYFYDIEAVKEPLASDPATWGRHSNKDPGAAAINQRPMFGDDRDGRDGTEWGNGKTRNLRSVWAISTAAYSGSHYAAFGEKLIEPMVKAGTSQHGACVVCRAPWERVVEGEGADMEARYARGEPSHHGLAGATSSKATGVGRLSGGTKTVGWRPTCTCGTEAVRPCVVLDPFAGTCTTARVASRWGRRAVCFDLSDVYLRDLATKRTSNIQTEMML